MRVGSIFSGIGGIELGLGLPVAWHVENDPHASSVLARHFPGIPNLGDITRVDWSRVEPVDLLVGGPPCQPISTAGKRMGRHDPRWLWRYVWDAVRVLRPRHFLIENPPGILWPYEWPRGSGRWWRAPIEDIMAGLAEVGGYRARWDVFSAAEVRAPHRRDRVFIFGALADPHSERAGAVDGRAAAPDATSARRERPTIRRFQREQSSRGRDADWGIYAPAIARWEQAVGRPAPPPVDERGRLAVPFVEWMVGFPPGWMDGIPRTAALRCLGNAVLPQVAALAWSVLTAESIGRTA